MNLDQAHHYLLIAVAVILVSARHLPAPHQWLQLGLALLAGAILVDALTRWAR